MCDIQMADMAEKPPDAIETMVRRCKTSMNTIQRYSTCTSSISSFSSREIPCRQQICSYGPFGSFAWAASRKKFGEKLNLDANQWPVALGMAQCLHHFLQLWFFGRYIQASSNLLCLCPPHTKSHYFLRFVFD